MFFKKQSAYILQYPTVNFISSLISIQTNSAITNYSQFWNFKDSNSWQFLLRKIYSKSVKWFAY